MIHFRLVKQRVLSLVAVFKQISMLKECLKIVLKVVLVFFGGFKGQVRWPEGPPHLALNPPYLLFVFCCFFVFVFCFVSFFEGFYLALNPPYLSFSFCLYFLLFVFLFPSTFFDLPLFLFLFLCLCLSLSLSLSLSLALVFLSSFSSFFFAFFLLFCFCLFFIFSFFFAFVF